MSAIAPLLGYKRTSRGRPDETNNRLGNFMTFKKNLTSLVLSLTICGGAAHAVDDGLITKPSKYSVNETVTRFEDAVKQKEAAGFMVLGGERTWTRPFK
jgi:hypothetical protein